MRRGASGELGAQIVDSSGRKNYTQPSKGALYRPRVEKRGSVTQVEIFGQTYNVRAEGDSTYIHDLARLVDSRMKEVAERTATVDTTKIAILAALNITDDLYQSEKRRTGEPTDFRARAERLIRKLDDALGA